MYRWLVAIAAKLTVKLALRWARKRTGLTQSELAKRAGLSQLAVAQLEDPTMTPLSTCSSELPLR